jgi:hypothetical protein
MGDTLGMLGRGAMSVGRGIAGIPSGYGRMMIGTVGPEVNKGEQLLRIIMAASAMKNPAQFMALRQSFDEQDAARRGAWGSEPYQEALRSGGPEAAQRLLPGVPLPPTIPVGETRAGTENYAAVPSKPGEPTTRAYALPPTPIQLQERQIERTKDVTARQSKGAQRVTAKIGPKGTTYAIDEREQITVPEGLIKALGVTDEWREVPAPNGQVYLERRPGFEEAEKTTARLRAEKAERYGVEGVPTVELERAEDIAKEQREEKRRIEAEKRAKAAKAEESVGALSDIDRDFARIDTLVHKPGVLTEQDFSQKGVLSGLGSVGAYNAQQKARLVQKDPDLVELHGLEEIVLSLVAKSLGKEVGNLSQNEREGARAMTPNAYDTQVSADRKITTLRTITAERIAARKREGGITPGSSASPLDEELRRRGLVR